jgi:uncharacterized protein involved in exopolysaccharide biosynthesis
VVYVSPKFPKMLSGDSEVDNPVSYDSYIQDQIQTVTRYDIIAEAISKLPYSVRHQSGPALPYEIQVLQRTLEVTRIGTTYEVSIGLRGPSPNGLADTVNVVTEAYVERAKNDEFYGLNDRLKTLHQEKERLQNEMGERLAEQAHLMQQLGVATIATGAAASNPYDSTSERVREQLATARMQREAAEAQLNAVLQGSGFAGSTVADAAADDAVATDPSLSGVMGTLNSRRAALIGEMNGLRSDHPIYQKDKTEIASIDSQVNDLKRKAADQLQGKLLQDVTRTRLLELNLIQELGENTHTATSAAPKFQRAAELGPEIDSLQKANDAIGGRMRDLELESSSPGSIHMSTMALTPLGPEKSRLPIFLFILIVFSLGCAIAIPVGIDRFDNRLYTSQDVERVVGFHPLSVLLDDGEFSKELVDEYYLRLAAAIDHAVRNSGARTFLFTSTAHGSGTSTVVRMLSDKLRRLNLRTKTIIQSERSGLDILRSNAPLPSELVLKGKINPKELRTSPFKTAHGHTGYYPESGAPALESVMGAVHHAGEQWDVVLIDAVPLPISAYTEYLARGVDATVLVVSFSKTTKQELERAARLLERLDVNGVGVILNKMSLGRADRVLKGEFRTYEQSLKRRRSSTEKASARRSETSA